jgi:hypothetical protein
VALAAWLGVAHTQDSSLRISQPALGTDLKFDRIGFEGRSFDPPLYYGFRVGLFARRLPYVGFETEFIHLKVYAKPARVTSVEGVHLGQPAGGQIPLGEIVQRYSISHGVNLLLFNLAGRYRVKGDSADGRSRFILSARIGIGPTIPHTESTIDGQNQEQYEGGALAFQIGGGAEARLKGGLYAIGEYKFTRTRQTGKIFSGEAESLLRSHHGVAGLSYHF